MLTNIILYLELSRKWKGKRTYRVLPTSSTVLSPSFPRLMIDINRPKEVRVSYATTGIRRIEVDRNSEINSRDYRRLCGRFHRSRVALHRWFSPFLPMGPFSIIFLRWTPSSLFEKYKFTVFTINGKRYCCNNKHG